MPPLPPRSAQWWFAQEIQALEAHALNPVRFLVVPRVIAACLSMTVLAVIANWVAIIAAMAVSVIVLDIPYDTFKANLLQQGQTSRLLDWRGEGHHLHIDRSNRVLQRPQGHGGAAGVGKATTGTVVQCVVAIIVADLIFTAIFYALKLV